MNVASLENCKELYELSGWESDWMWWKRLIDDNSQAKVLRSGAVTTRDGAKVCPAYDCGYLLRKLPKDFEVALFWTPMDMWEADYDYQGEDDGYAYREVADTPEDALCKLAIELFKRGVLTTNNQEE